MVYLTAASQSKAEVTDSTRQPEGITMPRATWRPIDERARALLRDAQRVESDAVALVLAAELNQERTRTKLDAVIAKHQVAIDEADHALSRAQAHLVSVSGMARAALLVDRPVAALRAAVRAATGRTGVEPA